MQPSSLTSYGYLIILPPKSKRIPPKIRGNPSFLECYLHKQGNCAQNDGADHIGIPTGDVPERAVGFGGTLVDLAQQVFLLHDG